jgi:CheY-like chemotaxis protein/two-component sensor histidine kinase
MLDDLLDVARITHGHIELERDRLDLRAVVEQAVEAQRPRIDAKRQRLVTTLPARPVVVVGDAVRLQQVASNLLDNAAKYTPAGGTVWLSLDEAPTGMAVLRVRDDGSGVPADKLDAIFDLFTQANPTLARTEGGLGLGLTLVKRLVELHGGHVHAESEGLGRGAELVVRLPLAPLRAAPAAPATAPAGGTARRVLVIEDNDDGREMLVTSLRFHGHEVFEAATGREGLEEAARSAPDVVLIDIGLPDLDGYDVGHAMRQRLGPSVRLVALTGYGQPGDRERSARAGFDRHLVKPVDPLALAEIVRAL